jgi:hypothetical protein
MCNGKKQIKAQLFLYREKEHHILEKKLLISVAQPESMEINTTIYDEVI